MLNREPVALEVAPRRAMRSVGERKLKSIETFWSPGAPLFHGRSTARRWRCRSTPVGSGWRLINEGGQAEGLVLTRGRPSSTP